MRTTRLSVGVAFFVGLVIAPNSATHAEDIDTAWVRWYDGPAALADDAFDVDVDDAGNVYVAGSSQAPSGMFNPIHVLTMKFTADGDTVWIRRLLSPGASNEQGKVLRHTSDGGVVVAASSNSLNLWVIKYDAAGDTVWTRPYAFLFSPVDMDVNADGDVWIIGRSGTGDWRTVHYSADGTFQWVATFAEIGGGDDYPNSIDVDGSDNAYVTGLGVYLGGNADVVTIKYSPSGSETWRRRYNSPFGLAESGVRVKLAGDDTVYVAGTSESASGINDFLLMRYTVDGDTVWVRRFDAPGTGPDVVSGADVDDDGNMYLAGNIFTSGSTSQKGVVKFNSAGDTLWARYWGPPLSTVRDVVARPSGGFYMTGEGVPPSSIFTDWGIQAYTADGDSAWFRWLYNGISPVGFQFPHALAVSPDGGLVACGLTSSGFGGSNNVTVAKFVSSCSCPYQCDFDSDGFLTALDLSEIIDILFAGHTDVQDATCPSPRADFDCDSFSTALDLSGLIDHLFAGGAGPCDPCSP